MDSRFLWGTVEMLILEVISRGPAYGYQITQTVLNQSQGFFELKEGSLYPALHKMERKGFLSSYWVDSNEGRRRKYYKITAEGQKVLQEQKSEWKQFAAGVNGVMGGLNEAI